MSNISNLNNFCWITILCVMREHAGPHIDTDIQAIVKTPIFPLSQLFVKSYHQSQCHDCQLQILWLGSYVDEQNKQIFISSKNAFPSQSINLKQDTSTIQAQTMIF